MKADSSYSFNYKNKQWETAQCSPIKDQLINYGTSKQLLNTEFPKNIKSIKNVHSTWGKKGLEKEDCIYILISCVGVRNIDAQKDICQNVNTDYSWKFMAFYFLASQVFFIISMYYFHNWGKTINSIWGEKNRRYKNIKLYFFILPIF